MSGVFSLRRWSWLAAAAALPLAACGSDTSLLSSGLADPAPLANTSLTARPISRLVAFRPPVGPPESVNGELARQLNDAAIDNGVALVTDASYKHDVMLRGYVTALRKGTAVNPALKDTPENVNTEPYGSGWMIEIEATEASEVAELMTADAYTAHVAAQ